MDAAQQLDSIIEVADMCLETCRVSQVLDKTCSSEYLHSLLLLSIVLKSIMRRSVVSEEVDRFGAYRALFQP